MTDKRHTACDLAQVLNGHEATIPPADVMDAGDPCVEFTVDGSHIPPSVLKLLGEWGFSVNPNLTATRSGPMRTTVVAEEVSGGE